MIMNERDLLIAKEFLSMMARFKEVGDTPASQYMHGPGGLLSYPGMNPGVLSTIVSPLAGVAAQMPIYTSVYTNEVYGILTGLKASTGEQPTEACENFPVAGDWKLCRQTYVFGRMGIESQIIQVDRAGDLVNRGEWVDLRLINNPLGDFAPNAPMAIEPAEVLRNEGKAKLLAAIVALHRDYAPLLWTGNPQNTDGSEGYQEYAGLQLQVNDGYQDVVTKIACPSADAKIIPFGDTIIQEDPEKTVLWFTEIYSYLINLMRQLKINGVKIKIAMPRQMFRSIAYVWPCAYYTYRCFAGQPAGNLYNPDEQVKLRDDMLQNEYLLIEGDRVEVITDDSMPVTKIGPGEYSADPYFLPFGIVDGKPLLYWDYRDMRASQNVIDLYTPEGSFTPMRNGMYLLHRKPPHNECVQIRLLMKPRAILRAPFLSARLTGVRYITYINDRSPFPDAEGFYNGGVTGWSGPSFYPNTAD
jgi:hypothetical protein